MDAARDPRLRSVVWKDLLPYRRLEVVHELTLSLPWLAASLLAAHAGWHAAALAASFVFFLTTPSTTPSACRDEPPSGCCSPSAC
jgi:hypothetical protein